MDGCGGGSDTEGGGGSWHEDSVGSDGECNASNRSDISSNYGLVSVGDAKNALPPPSRAPQQHRSGNNTNNNNAASLSQHSPLPPSTSLQQQSPPPHTSHPIHASSLPSHESHLAGELY